MGLLQCPGDAFRHVGLPPVVDHDQEVEVARSWLESAQRRRPVEIRAHQCRTNNTGQAFPQHVAEIRNRATSVMYAWVPNSAATPMKKLRLSHAP